jgi:hypothetical protein
MDLSGHGREVVATMGTNWAEETGNENWASGWASRVRKHAIWGDTMRQEPSPRRENDREEKSFVSRKVPQNKG